MRQLWQSPAPESSPQNRSCTFITSVTTPPKAPRTSDKAGTGSAWINCTKYCNDERGGLKASNPSPAGSRQRKRVQVSREGGETPVLPQQSFGRLCSSLRKPHVSIAANQSIPCRQGNQIQAFSFACRAAFVAPARLPAAPAPPALRLWPHPARAQPTRSYRSLQRHGRRLPDTRLGTSAPLALPLELARGISRRGSGSASIRGYSPGRGEENSRHAS